jgi:hypothetical protein
MSEVFLSYARGDGEGRATKLRERLARVAPDIVIKQDPLFLEGGVGWWNQIADAIDSVEFLILLMTPRGGGIRQCAEGVALRPPARRLCLSRQRGARREATVAFFCLAILASRSIPGPDSP